MSCTATNSRGLLLVGPLPGWYGFLARCCVPRPLVCFVSFLSLFAFAPRPREPSDGFTPFGWAFAAVVPVVVVPVVVAVVVSWVAFLVGRTTGLAAERYAVPRRGIGASVDEDVNSSHYSALVMNFRTL